MVVNKKKFPFPLPLPPPFFIDSKVDGIKGGVEGDWPGTLLRCQKTVRRLVAALVADILQLLNIRVHCPAPLFLLPLLLLLLPHPELEEELQVRLVGLPTPNCGRSRSNNMSEATRPGRKHQSSEVLV